MSSHNVKKQLEKQHKKALAEHFSKRTEYWSLVYDDNQQKIQGAAKQEMINRRESVLSLLDDYAKNRSLRILDVGCGPGGVMEEVLKRGHNVVGVDISEEMLKEARETSKKYRHEGISCIHGDMEYLPFSKNSFDVVLCVGVLPYLQSDRKSISEISRVVKTGGIIIITLPNILRVNNLLDPYYYLNRGLKYILHRTYIKKSKVKSIKPGDFGTNDTFMNRRYFHEQLTGLFKDCGLQKITTVSIGFGPMTFWRKELFPSTLSIKISNLLGNIAKRKYFTLMNIFANRWVICLKK